MNKQMLFKSLLLIGFLIASTPASAVQQIGETRTGSSNNVSNLRTNELKLKSGGTQLGVRLDSVPGGNKQPKTTGTQLGGS